MIICSLTIGWLDSLPYWLLLPIVFVYGFAIIADSPIYNASLTEIANPDLLGTALGIQSVMGFSATVLSPVVFGLLLDLFGWGIAFTTTGLVTVITPVCVRALKKHLSAQDINVRTD